MRDAGRVAAAVAVLEDMERRHRPAKQALKAWSDDSRYAGSGDRAFVSGLVLDALRRRQSCGWRMGSETARAVVLATLRFTWDWPLERIARAADDPPHGLGALTPGETDRLSATLSLDAAPAWVAGDYPQWLDPHLTRVFGDDRAAEGEALTRRAPIDLRVNRLKTNRDQAAAALAPLGAAPTRLMSTGLRIPAPGPTDKAPPVEAIPEFHKGWFEIQDLGSQVAAAAAGPCAGKQVLDYCAGGGGKTLAMAATMGGEGRIYAYDSDARRLADTARRLERAGADTIEVRTPLRGDALAGLEGRMDVVFVDAPCTGSGTWRRHPDAKWRLTPAQLDRRMAEQDAVLATAARFVAPGGHLVYVTCSLLMEENEDRLAAFLAAHPAFDQRSILERIEASGQLDHDGLARLGPLQTADLALRLSPWRSGTDGFFIGVLGRRS
jgi:16S rRNA (cytosine967-C5)-methyltransferase